METPQSIKDEAKAFAKTDCYDDPFVDGKMTNYPYTNKEKYEAYIAGRLASQKEIEELGTKLIKAMQEANELGEENRKLKEDLEQANKFFKNLYDE